MSDCRNQYVPAVWQYSRQSVASCIFPTSCIPSHKPITGGIFSPLSTMLGSECVYARISIWSVLVRCPPFFHPFSTFPSHVPCTSLLLRCYIPALLRSISFLSTLRTTQCIFPWCMMTSYSERCPGRHSNGYKLSR